VTDLDGGLEMLPSVCSPLSFSETPTQENPMSTETVPVPAPSDETAHPGEASAPSPSQGWPLVIAFVTVILAYLSWFFTPNSGVLWASVTGALIIVGAWFALDDEMTRRQALGRLLVLGSLTILVMLGAAEYSQFVPRAVAVIDGWLPDTSGVTGLVHLVAVLCVGGSIFAVARRLGTIRKELPLPNGWRTFGFRCLQTGVGVATACFVALWLIGGIQDAS